MIRIKKNGQSSRVYSKTQPDEIISPSDGYLQQQQAQNRLHQLSIFNSQFIISNHLTGWMKYHTESISTSKQTCVWEQGIEDPVLRDQNKTNATSIKKDGLNFVRKKKYERDNQFKKSIKEAVKQSKKKHSCTAFNFSIPLNKLKNHQRIHSQSMRINCTEDEPNEPSSDFSKTTTVFNESETVQRKNVLRSTFLHRKSERKHCSLLVRKKKQKTVTCLGQIDRLILGCQFPYKNYLTALTNLITVEKEKVALPQNTYQCHSKLRGKIRKERFSTMN